MVPSVTEILNRFKTDWIHQLQPAAIEQACRDVGHVWRDRLLTPVATIQLFFLQILHGNTACTHLPHLSGLRFTGEAYCQARSKLPLEIFQKLLERFCSCLKDHTSDEGLWKGHRTFFADGSGVSMPDTPEWQLKFGQPSQQKPGCGFPVAHLLCLTHAGTGLVTKILTGPLLTHDLAQTPEVHPEMKSGDVFVADRAFCSYVHLALLMQAGIHAVFRVGGRRIIDFTPNRPFVFPATRREARYKGMPRSRWIKQLSKQDQIVDWFKTKDPSSWFDSEKYDSLPGSIRIRELRYRVEECGFRTREVTLVTTLLDAELYTIEELATLYLQRWQIETDFAHLKTTMKMDVLKCKTVPGVMKELSVFVLVYNLVRMVMLQSAKLQNVNVERISFIDALRWLASAETVVGLGSLVVNPLRPNRVEPRVRKRRPKNFAVMVRPRAVLRQELMDKRLNS